MLDYSSNYSDATGSLWFYAKDKGTNFNTDIVNTKAFKSFQYKAKLLENTVAQPEKNNNNGVLKNATFKTFKTSICTFKTSKIFLEITLNAFKLRWTNQSFHVCLVFLMMMIMMVLVLIILFL